MYEVELKVELTDVEKENLITELHNRGFFSQGITPQNDYYIEAKDSPYGGYDLKRYRNENGVYIYTEKIWEMEGDVPARRENEHEVSKDDFEKAVEQFPDAVKIKKDREWFKVKHMDTDISMTIDGVKFDHSEQMRYFIEAEIGVSDKKKVAETKAFIKDFLKDILNKQEIAEAAGMFTMAMKKL